ncbi:hypothetical protein [Halobaculum limi]|uniref:hypothetical protein n=1 Tax=Halobaculum limi TaxID=3031916 RepID=UPI002406CD28|nr:hypothetical protein [Halobaculum sp. YSMS11]
MATRRTRWALGATVGVAVGVANWTLFVPNVPLTATLVVLFTVGSGLLIRAQRVYQREGTDTDSPDWWAATGGPLTILVGIFGLNTGLGLSFDLRVSLLLLAVGAMLAAYGVGIVSAVAWFDVGDDPADGTASDPVD